MGLFKIFQKEDNQTASQAEAVSESSVSQLSGDSTVAEWLNHPIGGAILREMLEKGGQKESALSPVKRMPLKKLVALSRGKFTEDQMNEMIVKANSGQTSSALSAEAADASAVEPPADSPPSERAEWVEKITPGRFDGQTVIVTGAGSGIGRATASRVAREGGRVIAVDISGDRLKEFAASLQGMNIVTITADITSDEDIKKITAAASGQVDALANVAGIMDNMTPLHEVTDEIWDRVMSVNVTGMMKLTRAVLPLMLEHGHGSVVNVGSEASLRGSAAGAAYTTSKHAVIGLTKSSAFMYGPSGIRVNAVAPGGVITNIEARFDSKLGEERVNTALALMPDAATSEELAAAITFLLSDDSVNINGAILASDGGWSAA